MMKSAFAALLFAMVGNVSANAKIDPRLQPFLNTDGEKVASVIVLLSPVEREILPPKKYQRARIIRFLQDTVTANFRDLQSSLGSARLVSKPINVKRLHWISNSLTAEVTSNGLRTLASLPHVQKIYLNGAILQEPTFHQQVISRREATDMPYNFKEVGLDKVITEMPEFTGKGVYVGHIDTGVDGQHPSLKSKIAVFFDSTLKKNVPAYDSDAHGSHTAGTILGGNRSDVWVGMAPEAKLVASGPLNNYDGMLVAMEYMLAPKGEATRDADVPVAVSNSWNCGGAPDIELFYRAITAWEAGGILPVFSAGNEGPRVKSITPPHEHPLVLAVGATGLDGKLTSFSSRGPGVYHGKETQKPDLTAPGEDILSTLPRGRFGKMSGTSMAAPHVAGIVALIHQANPTLNPAQIRELLTRTSTPTTESGKTGEARKWNALYGFGKMNAYEALRVAKGVLRNMRRGLLVGFVAPSFSNDALLTDTNLFAKNKGMNVGETDFVGGDFPDSESAESF